MIQTVRRRFIITNMALVSIVLLAVLSIQVFSAYRLAADQVDRAMAQSLEFLKGEFDLGQQDQTLPRLPDQGMGGRGFRDRNRDFLSVPAFAVEVDEAGQIIDLCAAPGVEVTQTTAQALIDVALARSGTQGSLPGEHMSYLLREENGRQFFAFADNSSIGQTIGRQLLTSLLILVGALAAFYLISRFLASRALHAAEEAWDKQRQFVADASHELKTPITVILANTDIVLSHPEKTVHEERKWIDYTRDEAIRMKSLVNDLLFLAKSDAAQCPPRPAPVRLSDLVASSLMAFESVAFEAGITLTDHVVPGLTVLGDEAQLRRLAVILLDNAVKYAGEDGIVTVSLDSFGDQPRLTVHNTGPAIPKEHQAHLFERFYRADAARDRERGGYGLGLAIAKSIVDAHACKISVASTPEAGTSFTVVFPKSGKVSKTAPASPSTPTQN